MTLGFVYSNFKMVSGVVMEVTISVVALLGLASCGCWKHYDADLSGQFPMPLNLNTVLTILQRFRKVYGIIFQNGTPDN